MSGLRANNASSTRGRPFPKGNPGRRPGSRNKNSFLVESILAEDLEAVAKAVSAAARGGDVSAARLILDRLAPVRRGRPTRFKVFEPADAQAIAATLGNIVSAMARGELTAEEAQAVSAVLEVQRRALETSELEERLKALEGQLETTQVPRRVA